MNHLVGDLSERMKKNPQLWPSAALRYRELRVNRTLYLMALVLEIVPWIFHAINNPAYPTMSSGSMVYSSVVAAGLGLGIFWNDRLRGHLSYVLEGPASRQNILRTKIWFSVLTLLASYVVMAISILAASAEATTPYPGGHLLVATLVMMIMASTMAMLALAMGSIMGSVIYAAIATATLGFLPQIAATAVFYLTPQSPVSPGLAIPAESASWFNSVLTHAAPLGSAAPPGATAVLALLWFLLLSVALGTWSTRWWAKVPTERMGDAFCFPYLWNFFYAFLAALSSLVLTATAMQGRPDHWTGVIAFLFFFVLTWFVWRYLITAFSKLRSRPSNPQHPQSKRRSS